MSASKVPTAPIFLSLIIPVYNRPDEIEELLESLTQQTNRQFEVIIVEDGSTDRCEHIAERYKQQMPLRYHFHENKGRSISRNVGCSLAQYDYFVIFDSDCIIPRHYVETVCKRLETNYLDCYGGPDQADESFTVVQRAINYAMTSFLTTGGIRGGSEKVDKFYPRSFNMGISRQVFEATGGFSDIRFGEDIDLSIRILKAGFQTGLIKQAYVFHKRRTSLSGFFRQVRNFGIARIYLSKRHPGTLKAVHAMPAIFVVGCCFLVLLSIFLSSIFWLPLLLYAALLFSDSFRKEGDPGVAGLSVIAGFIQLWGYGLGFLAAWLQIILLGKTEQEAFAKNKYK